MANVKRVFVLGVLGGLLEGIILLLFVLVSKTAFAATGKIVCYSLFPMVSVGIFYKASLSKKEVLWLSVAMAFVMELFTRLLAHAYFPGLAKFVTIMEHIEAFTLSVVGLAIVHLIIGFAVYGMKHLVGGIRTNRVGRID